MSRASSASWRCGGAIEAAGGPLGDDERECQGFWRDSLGIHWPHIIGVASAIGFVLNIVAVLLGSWRW